MSRLFQISKAMRVAFINVISQFDRSGVSLAMDSDSLGTTAANVSSSPRTPPPWSN